MEWWWLMHWSWIGFLIISFPTIIIFQCSFRRRKKLSISLPLNSPSPDSYLRNSSDTKTPSSSGVIVVFPAPKSLTDFPEVTQSTQSVTETLKESRLSKKPKTNKPKIIAKKKNLEKRDKVKQGNFTKTAKLSSKLKTNNNINSKQQQNILDEDETQEESCISPTTKAFQNWHKKMRKEFPEFSERTQRGTSSIKRTEFDEYSNNLEGSPCAPSPKDNLPDEHHSPNIKNNPDKTATTPSYGYISHHHEVPNNNCIDSPITVSTAKEDEK